MGRGTFIRHQDPEQIPEYAKTAWDRKEEMEIKIERLAREEGRHGTSTQLV